MTVNVVLGTDRHFPETLRACGAQVTIIDQADFTALAQRTAPQPDLLVIDLREHGVIPAALSAVRRQHRLTSVLLVLPRMDAALMLDAMRAGATECLAAPFSQPDLHAALHRLATQSSIGRPSEVCAIVGAKGGVGATTLAVNMAAALAALQPSSTLLMDLHAPGGDAALFLGAEPRFSIVDALTNMHRMDASFLRSAITTTDCGVGLLPSSDRPVSTPIDISHVRSLVELAAAEFPYVILDVPHADTELLGALEPVRSFVVVVTQDIAAVRGAARVAAWLEERHATRRLDVVISRYDPGAAISRQDVERAIGRAVSCVFPDDYSAAVTSLNRGRPMVMDRHAKLAAAYASFAKRVARVTPEAATQPGTPGVLSLMSWRRWA